MSSSNARREARHAVAALLPLASALAAPPALAAPAPRAGRVVRVQGRGAEDAGTPRLCVLTEAGPAATCVGLPPAVGDRAVVVDRRAVLGELRVREVGAAVAGCAVWTARGEVERGDLSTARPYQAFALIDVPFAPTGRVVANPPPPSGRADQPVQFAFDRDGDGDADFLVTLYRCDDVGPPSGASAQCFELWADDGRGLRSLRRDVLACT